jgi:hypothetical protein
MLPVAVGTTNNFHFLVRSTRKSLKIDAVVRISLAGWAQAQIPRRKWNNRAMLHALAAAARHNQMVALETEPKAISGTAQP